jgi:hypothetical protein
MNSSVCAAICAARCLPRRLQRGWSRSSPTTLQRPSSRR